MKAKTMTDYLMDAYSTGLRSLACYKKPLIALVSVGLCIGAGVASAQDITMPTVDIAGIDADSSGDAIIITIIKFVARIALWSLMVIAGGICIKRILGSWNEQKQNDQGRWGAVVSDSIGSVIMVILVIALCTWLLTFLQSS